MTSSAHQRFSPCFSADSAPKAVATRYGRSGGKPKKPLAISGSYADQWLAVRRTAPSSFLNASSSERLGRRPRHKTAPRDGHGLLHQAEASSPHQRKTEYKEPKSRFRAGYREHDAGDIGTDGCDNRFRTDSQHPAGRGPGTA